MSWLTCIISNVFLTSLLVITAWFVQTRLRSYRIARVLWVLVLIKLVTPPLVPVPLVELPRAMACSLGVCGCDPHANALTTVRDTLPWILVAIWSAGAVVISWTAWHRWTHFRRLLAHACAAPATWQSQAASLAAELALKRPPEILMVPCRLPPLVIPGWRRPRMLLPEALVSQLDAQQRVALLLHELVHIQRGDHLVRILELVVRVAYWWLPVVGAIGRQLRTCEESCCDAAVTERLPDARREYAQLLLDVIEFAHPIPKVAARATAMGAAHDLEYRLRAILRGNPSTRRAGPLAFLALAAACALFPCSVQYSFALGETISESSALDGCDPASPQSPAANAGLTLEPPIYRFCCPQK